MVKYGTTSYGRKKQQSTIADVAFSCPYSVLKRLKGERKVCAKLFPASILYKSIAGRYRPVSYPDGPITARHRFIKNAYWVANTVAGPTAIIIITRESENDRKLNRAMP